MALRAVFDPALREAPNSFSSVSSVPPPCSSVLKDFLPCLGPAARIQHRWVSAGQREMGRILRGNTRRAGLAEAPASQCAIGVFGENPRSPRGFLRLVVQNRGCWFGPCRAKRFSRLANTTCIG